MKVLQGVLRSSHFLVFSKIILTFMFWFSGLMKFLDFQGTLQEMHYFGLTPVWFFAPAVIAIQLGGSLCVIRGGRFLLPGAGALALFTLLTIPIAHDFWNMSGADAFQEKLVVMEHLTVVGALMLVTAVGR